MLIATLLAAPAAEGLFTRAILHSGAAAATVPATEGEAVTARLAGLAARPGTREALCELSPAKLVALTTRTSETAPRPDGDPLLAALAPRTRPFSPVVDGDVVPRSPLEAAGQGAGTEVEVLLCTNRDEGQLFLAPTGVLTQIGDATLEAAALTLYGLTADGLLPTGPTARARPPAGCCRRSGAIRSFWAPTLALAEARVSAGSPTWLARFDAVTEDANDGLGSCHAADVPFAFGTIGLPEALARRRIGASPRRARPATPCTGTWVGFASGEGPGWARYGLQHRPTAVFTDTITVVEDLAGDERRALSVRQPARVLEQRGLGERPTRRAAAHRGCRRPRGRAAPACAAGLRRIRSANRRSRSPGDRAR